jgi:histidinol-phosphatase
MPARGQEFGAAFDAARAATQCAGMARSERLEAALAAAAAAAQVIRRAYEGEASVRTKPDGSPVTDADLAAERAIRAVVQERFPKDGFYGEESAADRMDAEWLWLVDPIDGTKSFVRRYPMFSTQIAVMRRGRLELGVSSAPIYGETAWAERGGGAWLEGKRIAVSRIAGIEEAALSTGNLRSLALGPRWAGLGRLVGKADRIRGYGDFLHYHLLASGRIEAVIESDVHILDVAALAVIVEEAGGRVTDLEGAAIGLATHSILATNGALHETILASLRGDES